MRKSVLIVLFLATIISWIISKDDILFISSIQLAFLLISIISIILFSNNQGLNYIKRLMSERAIGLKYCTMVFVLFASYIFLSKLGPELQRITFKGAGMGGPIQSFLLRNILLTSILLFIPFGIYIFDNQNINEGRVVLKDLITLFILFIFTYAQISWSASGLGQIVKLSRLFYLHLIFTSWTFIILPLLLFLTYRNFSKNTIGFVLKFKKIDIIYFLCAIAILISLVIIRTLSYSFPIPKMPITHWIFKGFYLFLFVALPAELLFRGLTISIIVQKFQSFKYINILAILISSLLYGLTHYWLGIIGIAVHSFIGLIYGIIFIKTKSITTPVLIHGTMDLIIAPIPF